VAEILRHLGDFQLRDLGTCEVKHGETVHLFNLYGEDYGNPELPERLRDRLAPDVHSGPAADPQSVVIVYRRSLPADERLRNLLGERLTQLGFPVSPEPVPSRGVAWVSEVERRLTGAFAVIPILSAGSVDSEMFAFEVETAQTASRRQGHPRLVPLRVGDTGPLPEPLATLLAGLAPIDWPGADDDEALIRSLRIALSSSSPSGATFSGGDAGSALEPPGGAVALDSRFYVHRPTDDQLQRAITRRDGIILVKGARQMGKTSLLARGLQQARGGRARVLQTDFQKLDAAQLESLEEFYLSLAGWIADLLDLDVEPEGTWNPKRGASYNFDRFVRREVLARVDGQLVWGLDEVDRLFTCDYSSEVFGLFRSWHNARSLDPSGPWSRLSLVIAYATEAHLFITDVNQSPFNVGTRITLSDFTRDQVADLNRRFGHPLKNPAELSSFCELTGGQPFLVRCGLHALADRSLSMAELDRIADRDEELYGDHLRRMVVLLARSPELIEAVRKLLRSQPGMDAAPFFRLRSAGVFAGESTQDARFRCALYVRYFRRHFS
jgi:hypothetical protein